MPAQRWLRTMRDPREPLDGTLFDALDGYVGAADTGWLRDTVFVARDGKVWMAGERGLAWLDPHTLAPNGVAPAAAILGLTSAGRSHVPGGPIELAPGARDIQIDYSVPSLRIPQRVRFRYRMAGAGANWQEAGARRAAFYSNLGPGEYTFEVVGVNDSGLAGAPATLRFRVAPRFTETPWFYSLCAAAAALLLLLGHRLRMRRLAAQLEERFRIRAHEREAVARTLHDTFLQSVQGLVLSLDAVAARLPVRDAVRAEIEAMLERARSVLTHGRDEVRGLRSDFGSGAEFWQLLMRDVALLAPDGTARVELAGQEAIDRLGPRLQHDVHAIAREAVANALRHTRGAVHVRATAQARAFVLSVTDEGGGMGAFRQGRPGHYGLQGMRERAARIGARLAWEDADGGGTRVTLTVPAHVAYDEAAQVSAAS